MKRTAEQKARGQCIILRSGRRFNFIAPRPEQFTLDDIAWGLAREGRWANQLRDDVTWSVGQHSLLVASVVPAEDQLAALLHDATEAFTGDLNKPLKEMCADFDEVEQRVWRVIAAKFAVAETLPASVKHADMRALHTEQKLFSPCPEDDLGLDAFPVIHDPFLIKGLELKTTVQIAVLWRSTVEAELRARGFEAGAS